MGLASSEGLNTPSVADDKLIATVVVNDMLLNSFNGEPGATTLAQLYLNQNLIPGLTNPDKRFQFMDQVLRDYVDRPAEAAPLPLFSAAGLIEHYTRDGVAEAMIKICREFNGLGDKDKRQWLREIQSGERFSSASFPPAEERVS